MWDLWVLFAQMDAYLLKFVELDFGDKLPERTNAGKLVIFDGLFDLFTVNLENLYRRLNVKLINGRQLPVHFVEYLA